ncbi:hypothetical protein [Leeia oryzae]|uniref:hypothetical protein n=1 Tax=Leeia oryzae TaxID=356662 RepID=UPI0003627ABE|nr:hypothetical protein [Leeia oryzae]
MSAQIFAGTLAKQSDEAKYLRECAKKLGFHSLYPDASFVDAKMYLVYSHLAYVFSAGDQLCERVRSTQFIKKLKGETAFFHDIDKGDFVTKTLALTVLASMPVNDRSVEKVNTKVEQLQNTPSFALVNYYRLIRNEELHASGDIDRNRTEEAMGKLPLDKIKKQYQMSPSLVDKLTSYDALLCSKAWQDVAKWFCGHMLGEHEVKSILIKRFGNLKGDRRTVAAKNFMKLELLYSASQVNDIMTVLNW